ncbi:MAG: (E)-4-hydroxy-3-methylbut-2-enyl-diphosphate synthase [Bacteroidales bacterium]|nr:(E)-4-hydroxy-3-methylbut-2-enyl-diphosphate synthase [Bacteroidales bacterium]
MLLNDYSFLCFTSYHRILTRTVSVGNVTIGGNAPIRIQTMTNTPTEDVQSTVEQIKLLYNSGAELVRIAVPTKKDIDSIKEIVNDLRKNHIHVPIIADVHFIPEIAEIVAPFVQKVRINPGNYVNRSKSSKAKSYSYSEIEAEKEGIYKKLVPLLRICKQYGTAIRIGMNQASLPWRIVYEWGNTPEAMVASAMEFYDICKSENFDQIIFSFKASDIRQTIYANRLYVKTMLARFGIVYPLHIGITEAGIDHEGILKSIIGIGTLLHDGIGDTIRVSLTGNPEKELPVAKKILSLLKKNSTYIGEKKHYLHNPLLYNKRKTNEADNIGGNNPIFYEVSNSSKLPINSDSINVITIASNENYYSLKSKIHPLLTSNKPIAIHVLATNGDDYYPLALNMGNLLTEGLIDAVYIQTSEEQKNFWQQILKIILQVSGARRTMNEYVSCPSCARTMFDIETVARLVKEATHHTQGYKIAIMGCVVNGPGEMHDADVGIVGAGKNKAHVYYRGEVIATNLEINEAIQRLLLIIDENNHLSHRKD